MSLRPKCAVPAAYLSAAATAPVNRANFWRDRGCVVNPGFEGSSRTTHVDHIQVCEIDTEPRTVDRGHHHLSRPDDEVVRLILQHSGSCHVEQNGRRAELRPGDCGVYSADRPYTLTFEEPTTATVLTVARAVFVNYLIDVDGLCPRRMSATNPHNQIFRQYVGSLLETAHAIDPADQVKLATCLLDLLSLAAHASMGGVTEGPMHTRSHHIIRIKAFIERNLSDPDLSVEAVARHHRMTTRYLQKLFKEENNSPARWILKRRLAKCREALAAPTLRDRTITEIAFRWGFSNAAHFSRVFKAAYGMTPREFRLSPYTDRESQSLHHRDG